MALPPITKRIDKGLALTYKELDDNFTNLDERLKGNVSDIEERLLEIAQGGVDLSGFTTDDIAEGDRLYFTTARANSAIDARVTKSFVTNFDLTTSDIAEGSRQYWTTARGNAAIDNRVTKAFVADLNVSTDDLVEGSANKFFTGDRVISTIDEYVTKEYVDNLNVDAETFRGLGPAQFLRSDQDDTMFGSLTLSGNVKANGNIISENGNIYSVAAPSADARMWLKDTDGSNKGIVFWDRGNDALRIRRYNSSGATDGDIYIKGDTFNFNGNNIWHSGNMGSGSGLDADLLDGMSSSKFLRNDQPGSVAGSMNVTGSTPQYTLDETNTGASSRIILSGSDTYIQAGGASGSHNGHLRFSGVNTNDISTFVVRHGGDWRTIWHSGNDGSGSGLDADRLDGLQASDFVRSNAAGQLDGGLTINQESNSAAMKLIKAKDIGTASPILIVAGDGEADDIIVEFRANGAATSVDQGDAASTDWQHRFFGDGDFEIKGNAFVQGGSKELWHDGNTFERLDHVWSIDTRDLPNSGGTGQYMPPPDDETIFNRSLRLLFSQDAPTNSWASIISVSGWSQTYNTWQLAGPSNSGQEEGWFLRSSDGGSWGTWREIWHSGNDGDFVKDNRATPRIHFVNNEMTNFNSDGDLWFDSSVGLYVHADNCGGTSAVWSSGNVTAGDYISISKDGEDKPTISVNASESASNYSIAKRNSSGDIYARLFRSTYQDGESIDNGAAIVLRNNTSDNYLRPTTRAAFMGWLKQDGFGNIEASQLNFNSGDYVNWQTTQGMRYYENGNLVARIGTHSFIENELKIRGGHEVACIADGNRPPPIGAIIMGNKANQSDLSYGDTTSGSGLVPTDASGEFNVSNMGSGTWMCLGVAKSVYVNGGDIRRTTIWQRIA